MHSTSNVPCSIFQDAMKQFNGPGIFWVDTSIRFLSSDLSALQQISLQSDGVTGFLGPGHSVFAVTPKEMLEFLPMTKDTKQNECIIATLVLLYKTKSVIDNIMHWWLACALSPKCIWSVENRICHLNDKWNTFANCSRYDQSALSILLYNSFANTTKIIAPRIRKYLSKTTLDIQRWGDGGKVRYC